MELFSLKNHVALVTGAGSGIGNNGRISTIRGIKIPVRVIRGIHEKVVTPDHLDRHPITDLETMFSLWKLENLPGNLVTRRHRLGLGPTRRHVQI